jgi:hypothetical protein
MSTPEGFNEQEFTREMEDYHGGKEETPAVGPVQIMN